MTKIRADRRVFGQTVAALLLLGCLVIGGRQALASEFPGPRISAFRHVVDVSEPSFVESAVNVFVSNHPEGIQESFLFIHRIVVGFLQNVIRLQESYVSNGIVFHEREVIQKCFRTVFGFGNFGDIFQAEYSHVAHCYLYQTGRGVPGVLERTAEHVSLIGSNRVQLNVAPWFGDKPEAGGTFGRGGDYPSAFSISAGSYLPEDGKEQQKSKCGYDSGRNGVNPVYWVMRVFGGLVCLGLMLLFANFAVQSLLLYHGVRAAAQFFAFVLLEGGSLLAGVWTVLGT